jgi:type IV fimbrial biogenesis protein FimT
MSGFRARGFTLTELLIGLAIAGILLVLALPNYQRWIADSQIANAASTVADGLRFAQAEAVKRNADVEFTLSGSGWSVQQPSGAAIKVSSMAEGGYFAALVPEPAGSTTVTFDSFGLIKAQNAAAPVDPFTLVAISVPGGSRPLRVLVGGGGTGIKVCDPKFAYSSSHPDGCP